MARCDFSTRTLFLSIRELANFMTPKFSNLVEYSPTQLNALQLGLKWHQKIQDEYISQNTLSLDTHSVVESFVSKSFEQIEGWTIVLRGRIDILSFNNTKKHSTIIEIKTSSTYAETSAPDPFWELQVLFYSYLFKHIELAFLKKQESFISLPNSFSLAQLRDTIKPQLLVIQTLTGQRTYFDVQYDEEEIRHKLIKGLKEIIKSFLPRINHFEQFRVLKDIPWFFDEYRLGQQENLAIIRKGLQTNPIAMLIGPPGTGKTALTLTILLERAIYYEKQIMYTSTKNSQQVEVLHLIKLINVQLKNPLWAVVLLAKEKYCVNEKKDNDVCDPFTCDFFLAMTKNPVNYHKLFTERPIIDSDWLKEKALTSRNFCPYYQAKYLAGFADFVIGDQNYQIDPTVKLSILKRPSHPLLFSKKGLPYVYLMDEAHNLPARTRDVLSLIIDFTEIQPVLQYFAKLSNKIEEFKPFYHSFNTLVWKFNNLKTVKPPGSTMFSALDLLDKVNTEEEDYRERITNLRQKTDEGDYIGITFSPQDISEIDQLYFNFYNQFSSLDTIFMNLPDLRVTKEMNTTLFQVREFIDTLAKILEVLKEEDKRNYHCFYFVVNKSKVFEVYFLNIADYFQEELKNSAGTIIMSATLHPEEFYRVLFGFSDEVKYLTLNNFFPEENRSTLIIKDIKTRFADLINLENLNFIAQIILNIQKTKKGRYLFFVPNLDLIKQFILLMKPAYSMCFSQFEQESLEEAPEGIFVCALGSIFSEGVNLPDLTGIIILSPGIPPPSYKNSLLQEYYKSKAVNGSKEESFNLAFRIPGLNKILQASGRLHRKNADKGIIYLLGERFATDYYMDYYPDFIKPIKILTSKELDKEINEFWGKFTLLKENNKN